jgi:excisionase family DNA binding protein
MTAVDPQELLTPDEVCALLKMKRTWFYAQVARGEFRPIKLGRSTRVRRRDLEAYLQLPAQPQPPRSRRPRRRSGFPVKEPPLRTDDPGCSRCSPRHGNRRQAPRTGISN